MNPSHPTIAFHEKTVSDLTVRVSGVTRSLLICGVGLLEVQVRELGKSIGAIADEEDGSARPALEFSPHPPSKAR